MKTMIRTKYGDVVTQGQYNRTKTVWETHVALGSSDRPYCLAWFKNFERFLHEMGPKPNGKTLMRTDDKKPHSPVNSKWVWRATAIWASREASREANREASREKAVTQPARA